MSEEHPELEELRRRLAQEESAYAAALDAMDALGGYALPLERRPEIDAHRARLNELAQPPAAQAPEKGWFGKVKYGELFASQGKQAFFLPPGRAE